MKRRKFIISMLTTGMVFAIPALGVAQGTADQKMLTKRERKRMHQRLQNAESEAERKRIRNEYRTLNKKRMKDRDRLHQDSIPGAGRRGGAGSGGGGKN